MHFNSAQARQLIAYVGDTYGRSLEYLWPSSPGNAIWRRGDNDKWFAALLMVKKNKIIAGADDGMIEILDIRCAPDMIDFIVDKKLIFPGWHMNKRHWITLVLDSRMGIAQIKNLLDISYELAGRK